MALYHMLLVSFTLFTFSYCLSIRNEGIKTRHKTIGIVVSDVCAPFRNFTTYGKSQKLLCAFCKGLIPTCWASTARPHTTTPAPITTTSTTISTSTGTLSTTPKSTEETTPANE